MNNTVLVTGASGFVGSHLIPILNLRGVDICAVSRTASPHRTVRCQEIAIGNINGITDWSNVLRQKSTIIHLAARVHVMHDTTNDPLASFRATNVEGTLNLARQAVEQNVKRFIFLSSIKVHGEKTDKDPFRPSDHLHPLDPYSKSKLEAEQGLLRIAKKTGLEVVIIRPPLIYGKGVAGNFARLQTLTAHGIPLPFASIDNKRSLLGIENLCHCIFKSLTHPRATETPLLLSDNHDVSTPELIRLLADASRKPARLLPFPVPLLQLAATFLGKASEIRRLSENLQVDSTTTMRILDWRPPVSLAQGIRNCFQ